MSSLIKAGTDLLDIFPRVVREFGGTYGIISSLNACGYLQYLTPLGTATALASASLTFEFLEFTRKQITSLKWIHESLKALRRVDAEISSAGQELCSLKESHPKHTVLTNELNRLNQRRSNINMKLIPYYVVCTITILTIPYFTKSTVTAFVNRALTSAITYLPNSVLTLTRSLSISSMGFVIGIIGVTGFLIALYRDRQRPAPKTEIYISMRRLD